MNPVSILKTIILAGSLGIAPAFGADLTLTTIQEQPDYDPPLLSPHIAVTRDRLVIAQNWQRRFTVYDVSPDQPKLLREAVGGFGNVTLTSATNGWVALCDQAGQRIQLLNVARPSQVLVRDFDPYQTLGCFGIGFDIASVFYTGRGVRTYADLAPTLWVGSSGDRRVVQLDVGTGKILKDFTGISGPFSLVRGGARGLFLVNGVTDPGRALPLILDSQTGTTLVGDRLGNPLKSGFEREYLSDIQIDTDAREMLYVNYQKNSLYRFKLDRPQNSPKISDLGVTNVRTVQAFGKCLVVLHSAEILGREYLMPGFRVFRRLPDGELELVRTIAPLDDARLKGVYRLQLDSVGNAFVSGWTGVRKIAGLVNDLGCVAPVVQPFSVRSN